MKVAKKQRANSSEEKISAPESTKKGSRTRRAQRSRLDEGADEKAKPSVKTAPIPSDDDSVVVIDDLLMGEDTGKKGEVTHFVV